MYRQYITALIAFVFLFGISCQKEIENPEFADDEIAIYFYGTGTNVKPIAQAGYILTVGETLPLHLQVAPADATVQWKIGDEVVSSSLEYTYEATQEENIELLFIVTRAGIVDTTIFNISSTEGGFITSNTFQTFPLDEAQSGTFTAEFDIVPSMDNMNGVVGFLKGQASAYGSMSALIRFSTTGAIDVYKNGADFYQYDNELIYTANTKYHVKADVDAVNGTYDVAVTPEGGATVQVATAYEFRNQTTVLDGWSIAQKESGTIRISNMTITTHTQNEYPIFAELTEQVVKEGEILDFTISANDPLGGKLAFTVENLPRFAEFTDNGNGTASFHLSPYVDCGGCDVGIHTVTISATNSLKTQTETFDIRVTSASIIEIPVNAADAFIYGGDLHLDTDNPELYAGAVALIGGPNVAMVMPFMMPEIPAGKKIVSASLAVYVTNDNSWVSVDYDLYGINARTNADVLGADFFNGTYDTDVNTEVSAIEAAVFSKGDGTGEFEFGATNLTAFLTDQVNNHAAVGKYVFLRINANRTDLPGWCMMKIASADHTDGSLQKPTLLITLGDLQKK